MSSTLKRLLLIANIVLLFVVCYFAVTLLNSRSAEISMPKVIDTCAMIVEDVTSGSMDHAQAKSAAEDVFRVDNYTPNIRIFEQDGSIFMQTDDPSLVGINNSDNVEFNCTELAQS
ncbi:MAG: hypothetical protein AAF429_00925 [Pseudomonadota bacterium]